MVLKSRVAVHWHYNTHVCYGAQRIVTMLTITMSYNTTGTTFAHSCTADHVLSVPHSNLLPPLVSRFESCSLYHEATIKLINSENPHLLCETLCVSLLWPVRALSSTYVHVCVESFKQVTWKLLES